ncbi:MAG: hypothetical protein ACKV2T_02240 [Kofleriaceae bacterium]
MPSNSYDLVVLGDDLSALVCAALCARRGLRTLVLGDDRPARYQLGPHKLPIEPLVWPTMPGNACERVLKELHAELALRRKLREPKIAAQLVSLRSGARDTGAGLRIDLGVDRLPAELLREVGRDPSAAWIARWDRSGELARQLDALLSGEHALPGVGFFEKRELAKLAERASLDANAWWSDASQDPHAALWKALASIALRHPAASPIAMARAIDAWRAGPSAMKGDGDGVRELLVEKLTTAGGEIRSGKLSEISVSWSKIASVTLANGDELGAGQVVASRPPSEIAELLGKKAPKRLAELAQSTSVVGYRYTLNVVLDEAGIPEHMAPTVAVVSSTEKDPAGEDAFSIHLGEPDDTGRVIATIAAVLATEGPLEQERLASKCMALRAGLWRRLGDVMPFFERHLVLTHSPFEGTAPQVPGGRGSYDVPRNLPLAMPPLWSGVAETAVDRLTGGALTYTTGLKNLTLTGEQMLPSLGIEGAMAAGWSAAKVACAIAGKKKDYLRDETVGAA